jgi:hypothetical protein
VFRWAVDVAERRSAHETRKAYELLRLLDYDPAAMQLWHDMTPDERLEFGDDPEVFEAQVHYDPEPEPWEIRGIDPGEAHVMAKR